MGLKVDSSQLPTANFKDTWHKN